jgi:hypothetical protein
MLSWRDTIVEETRRNERLANAQKFRLIQTAKGQTRAKSGRFNQLMVSLGGILILIGQSLQRFDPANSKAHSSSAGKLNNARAG